MRTLFSFAALLFLGLPGCASAPVGPPSEPAFGMVLVRSANGSPELGLGEIDDLPSGHIAMTLDQGGLLALETCEWSRVEWVAAERTATQEIIWTSSPAKQQTHLRATLDDLAARQDMKLSSAALACATQRFEDFSLIEDTE